MNKEGEEDSKGMAIFFVYILQQKLPDWEKLTCYILKVLKRSCLETYCLYISFDQIC
jgi:hypothetical protein